MELFSDELEDPADDDPDVLQVVSGQRLGRKTKLWSIHLVHKAARNCLYHAFKCNNNENPIYNMVCVHLFIFRSAIRVLEQLLNRRSVSFNTFISDLLSQLLKIHNSTVTDNKYKVR